MSQPKKEDKTAQPSNDSTPEMNLQLLKEARKVVDAAVQAEKELYVQQNSKSDAPATNIELPAISQSIEGERQTHRSDQPSSHKGQDENVPAVKRALRASSCLKKNRARAADDILSRFLLVLYREDTEDPSDIPGYENDIGLRLHDQAFSYYQTLVEVHGRWKYEAGTFEHSTFLMAVATAKHFLLTLDIRDVLHGGHGPLTEEEKKRIGDLKAERKYFATFLESELESKLLPVVAKYEQEWEEAVRK